MGIQTILIKRKGAANAALVVAGIAVLQIACSGTGPEGGAKTEKKLVAPTYFKVDPATAGTLSGTVRYQGPRPQRKRIDMSGDPACVEAHHGQAYDESLVVDAKDDLANAFVYVKSGLEGKAFEPSSTPVSIDQHGCSFVPRVLGIQAGQPMQIANSDPVTHSIHPLAQVNREWNHSQGAGEPALIRRFSRPEVMIPVKCNIHSWMRAYIGVVDHPYFAVSSADGAFQIANVPPGDYVVEAWHEKLGTQEMHVTVAPSAKQQVDFKFKGE